MPKNLIAIFPGRFQPPHLGHIMTLMRIYGDYDQIIVTVSENTYDGIKTQVLPAREVTKILEEVFQYLPKIRVLYIGKGLLERDNYDGLPKFDVLVSGNPISIAQADKFGKATRFHPRSKIGNIDISGTLLRRNLEWE